MVIADGQHLRTAATAHVEAVHHQTGFERMLRHAALVSSLARPLQPVNQNQLAADRRLRLLGVHQYLDIRFSPE